MAKSTPEGDPGENTAEGLAVISCEAGEWPPIKAAIQRAIAATLTHQGLALTDPLPQVSVLLTTDANMRRLNREHRGRDTATNVLSFALEDGEPFPAPPGIRPLGDLVLGLETLQREAVAYGKSFERRLITMVVHGVLHLLGFDHERSPEEEARQEQAQEDILARLSPTGSDQTASPFRNRTGFEAE